jgi:diguanylate cyclase (GGDEF)-like protein/PAS domain S-box-containing protein
MESFDLADESPLSHLDRALLDSLPAGACLLDDAGRVLALNREGARLIGRTGQACLGQDWHALVGCYDNGRCPIQTVLTTGMPAWAVQATLQFRNGTTLPVEYRCVPCLRGSASGALFSFRDLRQQIQMQTELHRLSSLPEESPFPIVEMDECGTILYANPAMMGLLERFGYTAAGFPSILPPALPSIARQCIESGTCLTPSTVTIGETAYAWTFCAVRNCRLFRGFGTDLTNVLRVERALQDSARQLEYANRELLAAQASLKQQVVLDPLTGVLNRRGLQDALCGALARAQRDGTPLAVAMLDLDHFKLINDTHGHAAGDAVLQGVAYHLNAQVRPYDTIGRYGGEEFLLIFPGLDARQARDAAERLRLSLSPLAIEASVGHLLPPVTASFGIAAVSHPDRLFSVDTLVQAADSALYRAKLEGRNRVVLALEEEMQTAAGKTDRQF